MEPGVSNLRDALESAAARATSRGISVFDNRGRNPLRRTYPEVLAHAAQFARRWRAAGVSRGERILIALPTSWAWVDSWLGAVLAGAIPAVASPGGGLGSGATDVDRIRRLAETIRPRIVLLSESLRDELAAGAPGSSAGAMMTFEDLTSFEARGPVENGGDPSSTAFLQFTSGTEGFPRAVEISHSAVLHNVHALNEAILAPLDPPRIDSIVSWLPLHHDMGLAGAFLQAIATGCELALMPPSAFLARPREWLREVGSRANTLSLSPAFGFQYCVERVALNAAGDLDLGGWSAAVCGAETIHPQTATELASRFAGAGFHAQAFRPGYGLAEAAVAVTLDRKGKGARSMAIPEGSRSSSHEREVVCLGEAMADTEIRCVAPNGATQPDGEVGEILVRGPGLCSGYFGDEPATRAAFQNGWLRTGDLGFMHDEELYLSGRLKDVLIVRGENLMPHQLEWMAEGVCGGACRAAAFSIETAQNGEAAVLLVERRGLDRERTAAAGAEIRERICSAFGLQLADLVFVQRRRLPTTTSGKLRRKEAKSLYLAGQFTGSLSTEGSQHENQRA